MGKREDFWLQVPQDDDGHIRWPEEPASRAALVRATFGAKVIGALEAIMDEQLEVANGSPPTPGLNNYQIEAARRELFANMTEVQRREVRRLVKDSCFGTLYWVLVKLEHFPHGDVDFTVEPFTSEGKVYPRVGIEETELHHLYFEWLDRFSDYSQE